MDTSTVIKEIEKIRDKISDTKEELDRLDNITVDFAIYDLMNIDSELGTIVQDIQINLNGSNERRKIK